MHSSSSSLVLALLSLTPTIFAGDAFTIMASRPGSSIDNGVIQAADHRLWIGKTPTTMCDKTADPSDCLHPVNTVFLSPASTDNGRLALNVDINDGQDIFVSDEDGSLAYITPEAGKNEPIDIPYGFTYFPPAANSTSKIGNLTYEDGLGAVGLMACPSKGKVAPWQVFSNSVSVKTVPSGSVSDCVAFDAITNTTIAGPALAYGYA